MAGGIDELADATPASRDRYVDFLRALSIVVVVLGHWTIALISWHDGLIRATSAVGRAPGLWLATWACQVMPLFFFVGGYANLVAYDSTRRRGGTARDFIRDRVRRLLLPASALLAVWTIVLIVLHLTDTGAPQGPSIAGFELLRGVRPPGQTIPFGPLWFLLVYLAVVCLSPVTIALHRRFRWAVPIAMVVGTLVADGLGFIGGQDGMRYLNVVFVLLLPHQLGHFYGDGSVDRWPRRALWAMVVVGLGGLVLATNPWLFRAAGDDRFRWFPGIGHYPRSLLGTDVESVSNAYPPTLCFMLVGFWLIGLALLLRPRLTTWLQQPGPWKLTIAGNAWIMTLFLWHMTAYLIAIVILWPLGFGQETEPTLRWWLERPMWLLVPSLVLAGLVAVFGPIETRRRRAPAPTTTTPRADPR